MAKDHFMPLFVGDFLAATATWPGVAQGLYLLALSIQWSAGALPLDEAERAIALKVDLPTLQHWWPRLATKFERTAQGYLNHKLEEHRSRSAAVQEGYSRRGLAAVAAREAKRASRSPQDDHHDHRDDNRGDDLKVIPPVRSGPIRSDPESDTSSQPEKLPQSPAGTAGPKRPAEPLWWRDFKSRMPKRAGDANWWGALRAARTRLKEGHTVEQFLAGAERYALFIRATQRENTEFVQQASRFLGPSKPFLLDWNPPRNGETLMDTLMRENSGIREVSDGRGRTFDADQERAPLPAAAGYLRR